MVLTDVQGRAPVFKPTGWMSNSKNILNQLNKLCTNNGNTSDHRHVNLHRGLAAKAAVYPEKLCLAILKGLRKELIEQKVMFLGQVGTICEDADETRFFAELETRVAQELFWDDVSGRALKAELVRAAREDERRGCEDANVFTKVPIKECFDVTGEAPISTRWVDINKGDDDNPNYRSRWVGRDFKGGDKDRDDLFAATPLLEVKKLLIILFWRLRNFLFHLRLVSWANHSNNKSGLV